MPRWSVVVEEGPWKARQMEQTVQCCRTSMMDRCLCMEQRARGDLKWMLTPGSVPHRRLVRSDLNGVGTDTWNTRRTFVLWDRVIQFSIIFRDLPTSGRWPVLSFRIWSFNTSEFNRRGGGKGRRFALLPYRRNAFSWCFSRCSTYLDTSGSWCPVIYEGHWSVASTSSWLSRLTTSEWKGYHNLT